jgi:hypothetical protein
VGSEVYPGAGGGGAGAIGDDTVAGDGGGGGEHVSARIDIAELRNQGLDHIEVTVGKGGSGTRFPGQLGGDGEDTVLKFVARDGTVLKTICARGGSGGVAGALPDGVAELSVDDINHGGFCITTLMPSNAVDVRDGLVFVLGGDWKEVSLPQMPFDAVWPVVCTARWRSLQGAVARGIFLSLFHPAGHEISCQTLIVPADQTQGGFLRWIVTIGATLDAEGAWTLRLHSGGFLLAYFDVRVSIAR